MATSMEDVVNPTGSAGRFCKVAIVLWSVLGAIGCSFLFAVSTTPITGPDDYPYIPAWMPNGVAAVVEVGGFFLYVPWVLFLVPLVITGIVHLRAVKPKKVGWNVAWIAVGLAGLVLELSVFEVNTTPGIPYTGPAVLSWGMLWECAGFLIIGCVMWWMLAYAERTGRRRVPPMSNGL